MHDARRRTRWQPRHDGVDLAATGPDPLAAALGAPALVGRLLAARGLADRDHAHRFLQPRLTDLHDPALLPGALPAADRIARAIADRQPIAIYSDYDVDGVTGAAVLRHVLAVLGAAASVYIPHRLEEGYGLSDQGIDTICREAAPASPLIVSVDCGVTAVGPAAEARRRGVELIITDHHHFNPERLPNAAAIVHPQVLQPGWDQPYPCVDLCGAGVAFKLAWQVARLHCGADRLPTGLRELLVDCLSLVALGTIADVVPLTGENRVLSVYGLGRIKHTRFEGLSALIAASGLAEEHISAYHVGFVLGPRLNACGRMGHAAEALELLTDATGPRARELAEGLTRANDDRRVTERRIVAEAKAMVRERGDDAEDRRAIVVAGQGWHQGVVGVVASRLVDTFGRPAVVLSIDGDTGMAHGSARSVDGVSIHGALSACGDLFEKFGGHAMAAGLTLRADRVDTLRARLIEAVNARLSAEGLVRTVPVDAVLGPDDCRVEVFEQVARLEPFGRGNPHPRLLVRSAVVDRPASPMGRSGAHLAVSLRLGDRQTVRAVGFGFGPLAGRLLPGVRVDAVVEPSVNAWRGSRTAELRLVDLRPAGAALGAEDAPVFEAPAAVAL